MLGRTLGPLSRSYPKATFSHMFPPEHVQYFNLSVSESSYTLQVCR